MGEVLADSLESFLAVSLLLAMFVGVFTILGLHLFGDLELDIKNPNFSNFTNSTITVFQVCKQCALISTELWRC
jgi:hypothetical protein